MKNQKAASFECFKNTNGFLFLFFVGYFYVFHIQKENVKLFSRISKQKAILA